MAAAPHSDSIARDAVRSLEARLRRIEYLLAGTCEDPIGELEALDSAGRDNAVVPRLSSLERELSRIIAKSQSMKDLLQLCRASAPSPASLRSDR